MKNILGYRDYLSHRKIRETIKTSVNYRNEDIESSESICIFETSKQRTWLVLTERRLYLILDDIRKDEVRVNKSFKIDSLLDSNKNLLIKIDSTDKTTTGKLYLRDMDRGWFYSKKLFPNTSDLKESIERIFSRVR